MSRLRSFRRATALGGATLALAAVLSVLPLPVFDFVPAASARVDELPEMTPVSDLGLAIQQADVDEPLGSDRESGGEENVTPFALIAVTFSHEPVDPVLVRVRDDDGYWGEWRHLEYEADEGPDVESGESAGRPGTEPFWVGSADGYEVSLGAADVDHATVVTVREIEKRVLAETTPMAGAATMDVLRLRSAWGAAPATSIAYASTAARLGVVHHAVSSNNYTAAQVPAQLRTIQSYHQVGRGWADIGYNFVVDKFGGIWEGRQGGADRAVVGAHASGLNTGSFGVMMLGDYTTLQPTAASLESMARVVGWQHSLAGISSWTTIQFTPGSGSPKLTPGVGVNLNSVVGHRDVGYTTCPGTIYGHLGSIRARAAEWARWYGLSQGALEAVTSSPGSVTATGWAIDRARAAGAHVYLTVDGRSTGVAARGPRSDVAAQHGELLSGFAVTLTGVAPGVRQACVRVVSIYSSALDVALGCRRVTVADPAGNAPVGAVVAQNLGEGRISVSGWALDPNTAAPAVVEVQVDGVFRWRAPAQLGSNQVPSLYAGPLGTNHGFDTEIVGVAGATRDVCLKVYNEGPGVDVIASCTSVAVKGAYPEGAVENVQVQGRWAILRGWALDRETVGPVKVTVFGDGRARQVMANLPVAGFGARNPGYGDNHGFVVNVPLTPGRHQLCTAVANVGSGNDRFIGCSWVDIPK